MRPIQFAHIAPVEHILHAAAHSRVHMALQHLTLDTDLNDPVEYIKKFNKLSDEGHYIYLDNSQFELGKPCNLDDLIKAGHQIDASCLILPDGDMSEESIKLVKSNGFDVMVIPAGDQLDVEFLLALDNPDIDIVGLSYSKTSAFLGRHRHSATSRFDFLSGLGTVLPNKRIHLLGAVMPGEIALMKPYQDAIYSWDTSMAIWAGLNDVNIKTLTHKFGEPVDFTCQKQWNLTCDLNISYINTLLNS